MQETGSCISHNKMIDPIDPRLLISFPDIKKIYFRNLNII